MTSPRLSICIPTHHGRGAVLAELLESIESQLTDELHQPVELCISDNASRDGTEELVARCRERLGAAVVYRRNAEDLGLVSNMLGSVDAASGDYCWLVGSDDRLEHGAIERVLDVLERFPDAAGLGVAATSYGPDLTAPTQQYLPLLFPESATTTLYQGFEEVIVQVGWLFGLLSCNVVDRRLWLDTVRDHGDDARAHDPWPQVVLMTKMVQAQPRWVWYPRTLVRSRTGGQYLFEGDEQPRRWSEILPSVTATLADTWCALLPRALRGRFVSSSLELFANPEHLVTIRGVPGYERREDLHLLRRLTRRFWRTPYYWRRVVPSLLGRRPPRAVARRTMQMLVPTECRIHIDAKPTASIPVGAVRYLDCRIRNLGPKKLLSARPSPVVIAYRWHDRATSVDVLAGVPRMLRHTLRRRRRRARQTVQVVAPMQPGEYTLRISLLQGGVGFFDDIDPLNGLAWPVRVVEPVV